MPYRAKVALVRCPDYSPARVQAALQELIRLIGGLPPLSGPNVRVFAKINHLGQHPADSAIITHPELAVAIALTLRAAGGNVETGDGLDELSSLPYRTSTYEEVFRREGLPLVNLTGSPKRAVDLTDWQVVDSIPMPDSVLGAHLFVTLPKLKTHALTLFTGAVKNTYGLIPPMLRVELHRRFLLPYEFSRAVVDVFSAVPPGLVIMDAIEALEGSGPSSGGRPRHLGLLLAGTDAVAVDAVASALIGLDPFDVATTRIAHERGLGVGKLEEIEIAGLRIEDCRCPDFALPERQINLVEIANRTPRPLARLIVGMVGALRLWPRINSKRCTGCALCVRHCPLQAIHIREGLAVVNYDECISCFCCQEFCQSDAIRPGKSAAGRIITLPIAVARHIKHAVFRSH